MKDLTRRRFVAGAVAAVTVASQPTASLGSAPRDDLGALKNKVVSLPNGSAEQRRKKALLQWALEDVAAAQAAGMADDASALTADIEAALDKPLGAAAATSLGLFPKIATPEQNPWLAKTVDKVKALAKAGQVFPRGSNPEGKELGIRYGYPYIQLGQEGSMLAQAFGNPATDLFGRPELIAPMMRRFTASYEVLTPGSKRLADFGVSPHISEMYCLLNASFPDLVLPSRRAAWERALRLNCDAILRDPGQAFTGPGMPTEPLEEMFLHPELGDCYPNAQSHYMNALLFTGTALQDGHYLKVAMAGVRLMQTAFWPDGATAYINLQNECFTYHGIMIEDLARLWQVTGDALALQLVRSSRWYYPLSITPQGVAEYSSAPCWKHYWNGVKGTSTAALIASVERCGYNAQVAENSDPSPNWLVASLYVPVPKQPWWDHAMTYDRNIEGPRGRYGQYSFCGTARNTFADKRPKLTYVGSMWLDQPAPGDRDAGWPLDAGLDGAWAEVRVNDKDATFNRWDTHACLAAMETPASMANEDFGAVTSKYRPAQYGRAPLAFECTEQWLLTPQRLVGLLSIESLQDQEAYAMSIALKTVCGRANNGTRKQWSSKSANEYEYGGLTIRLWPAGDAANDLVSCGEIDTAYTDTFSAGTGKCGLLSLVDPAAAEGRQKKLTHYAKGTRYHAAVEIYPTAFGGATAVGLIPRAGGLLGVELRETHQTLRLIHNPMDAVAEYTAAPAGAMLHRSGEKHRLAFLPEVNSVQPVTAAASTAVPAGGHIVLRSVPSI